MHVVQAYLSIEDHKAIQNWLESHRLIDSDDCWLWTGVYGAKEGYATVGIGGRYYPVHRLSAMVYLKFDISSPLFICHRCDRPRCFNPDHLFPGTIVDNNRDRHEKGRGGRSIGEKHPKAILNEGEVLKIRRIAGEHSYESIARMYGVSKITIRDVIKRRSWKHI